MARILLAKQKLLFLLLIFGFFQQVVVAQINTFTDADRIRMRREAEDLLKLFFFNLNQIGENNPTAVQFREDDILNILSNNIDGQNSLLYNDITRVKDKEKDFFEARDYLNKVGFDLYKNGVDFDYITLNVKNPCLGAVGNDKYYFIKIEILKKLKGVYSSDNAMHIREDSIDVYVKFPILQNRPSLITGVPKIYKTELHQETECIDNPDGGKIDGGDLPDFENDILKARAVEFVRDYSITLNILGNPKINEIYDVLDYFEAKNTKVYNDIFPHVLRDNFPAEDYFIYVDKWFQQGIDFRYNSVIASNLLVNPTFVSVQVDVDRSISVAQKGFKHRERISVFVKFPIIENAVGAERRTPRIYKIEKYQTKLEQKNYISAGVQLAAINYFGDLNPVNSPLNTEASFTKPSIAIHFTKKITKRTYLRANLAFGRIKGDDHISAKPDLNADSRYRYVRNLHFRNDIQELSLNVLYDLKKNDGLFYRRSRVTPYIFAGLGVIHHNPKAKAPEDLLGQWTALQPFQTEGKKYGLFQAVVPAGFGVKVRFNSRIDLEWELGIRFTPTDYLDDVSGAYPDPSLLDPIARRFSNRTLEGTIYDGFNTGTFRQAALEKLIPNITGTAIPEDGVITTYIGPEGQTIRSVNGYGRLGDQRGNGFNDSFPNGGNDVYVITGFRLTYLLRVGAPPSTGTPKGKASYDFK